MRRDIDCDDAPAGPLAGAVAISDVVEPRQRAVIDGEGHDALRLDAERDGEGSANGAAMGHGDDVPAAVSGRKTLYGRPDACHDVEKAFAVGWAFASRPQPEIIAGDAAQIVQLTVGQAVPGADMLLGDIRLDETVGCAPERPRRNDGGCRLPRSPQMARHPNRLGWKNARERAEDWLLREVGWIVLLPIDTASMACHRRMPDPPPASHRRRHGRSIEGDEGKEHGNLAALLDGAQHVTRDAPDLPASERSNRPGDGSAHGDGCEP